MSQLQPITRDETVSANKVMRDVLNAMANALPDKDAETVRRFAEEKYPTHDEHLQHISNICPRHDSELLPERTESVCPDCKAEFYGHDDEQTL